MGSLRVLFCQSGKVKVKLCFFLYIIVRSVEGIIEVVNYKWISLRYLIRGVLILK